MLQGLLKSPTGLPWLDLSKVALDDDHVVALSETMRIWPVVSKLDLRGSLLSPRVRDGRNTQLRDCCIMLTPPV